MPVDIVLCMRVLRLLLGGSASMSFLYVYFFPFLHFEILENTHRTILMDFEEYNKTEDCEFRLVYIMDNKCVNVKYDYGDFDTTNGCI